MADSKKRRTLHPVCPDHWQKLRSETIKGLPFWSRPFAGGTVSKILRDQGFVESDTECSFCNADVDVDAVDR